MLGALNVTCPRSPPPDFPHDLYPRIRDGGLGGTAEAKALAVVFHEAGFQPPCSANQRSASIAA